MTDWPLIAAAISRATGIRATTLSPVQIGGGCTSNSYRLRLDTNTDCFVKLQTDSTTELLQAEIAGLSEMAQTNSLRTPRPICHGITANQAFLVLEYIPLHLHGDAALAGQQLAQLHRHTGSSFGWHRNNYIGATPQLNDQQAEWPLFWQKSRLEPQLQLARENGFTGRLQSRAAQLSEQLPNLLNHLPAASLLHGDLWSGNLAYDTQKRPVTFDPAVYYGDREADLAMTALFGGFSERFYAAYRESWPLSDGYSCRKLLYNLYHILNHLNLFGSGYLQQAERMIDQLLAEVKG